MNARKFTIVGIGAVVCVVGLGSIVYARSGSSGTRRAADAKVIGARRGGATSPTSSVDARTSSPSTEGGATTTSEPVGHSAADDSTTAAKVAEGTKTDTTAKATSASSRATSSGPDDASSTATTGHQESTSSSTVAGPADSATTAGTVAVSQVTEASTSAPTVAPVETTVPATTAPQGGGGGGHGGGGNGAEVITISKCFTNATAHGFGAMLIKAASSNPAAQLSAHRSDGSLIGEVQNGGGSRYGGTVMEIQPYDPGTVTITSSTGASATCQTGPFPVQAG